MHDVARGAGDFDAGTGRRGSGALLGPGMRAHLTRRTQPFPVAHFNTKVDPGQVKARYRGWARRSNHSLRWRFQRSLWSRFARQGHAGNPSQPSASSFDTRRRWAFGTGRMRVLFALFAAGSCHPLSRKRCRPDNARISRISRHGGRAQPRLDTVVADPGRLGRSAPRCGHAPRRPRSWNTNAIAS